MAHRFRRLSIIVAAVAAVVCVGVALVVGWALDPRLLKAAAESRLAAAIGQPVTIGAVHLSFLPTVTVVGTDILVGGARPPAASLEVDAIRMHPRIRTIFRRPIVIDRVEIDGLALNLVRDSTGRLIMPLPDPSLSAGSANTQTPEVVDVSQVRLTNGRLTITGDRGDGRGTAATVTPIQDLDATVQHTPGLTRLTELTASVGRSKVEGTGSVGGDGLRMNLRWTDLKAADVPLVFALLGTGAPSGLSIEGGRPLALDLRVDPRGDISASGAVSADRASFGTLTITTFSSPLAFRGSRLTLAPMTFHAYSGAGRGSVTANVTAAPVAWAVNVDLHRVNIEELVNANTTAKKKISGNGELTARLRGTSHTPIERTVTGTAAVAVANGTIRDFPLLSAIYSALRIGASGDRDLHFQALSGTFAIADARATTTDLLARTGEMTVRAGGAIGFDQSIAMSGTALFSNAKSDEFVHSVRELSSLKNSNGEIEVPFTVSGRLDAAHFSIDVRSLLGRGLQNELKRRLGDRLKDIFKRK